MNLNGEVSTELFKMKGGTFAIRMLSLYGKPWIIASVTILTAAILAAVFIDLRWGIIALMLIFIVTPGAFAFLYYYHAFLPVSVLNVIAHRIVFLNDKMIICTYPGSDDEATGENKEQEPTCLPIDYADISGYHTGVDSVTIQLNDKSKGFIWLPISAFPESRLFMESMELVISGIRNHKTE